MSFFIAVAFLCVPTGECLFWKSDKNFYDYDECKAVALNTVKKIKEENPLIEAQSVCFPIKPDKEI